jgi:hypothetical protein
MSQNPEGNSRRRRTVAGAGLVVAAGLIAGGVLAGSLAANAATTSPSTGGSSSSSGSTTAPGSANPGPGGSTPVRSDEKAVSSAQSATLTAAALKAVPGGTVIRVETDAGDGAYEVHMKKADGSLVTAKFDDKLAVIGVESGMGKGDPAPAGGQGGAPSDASGGQSGTSTGSATGGSGA